MNAEKWVEALKKEIKTDKPTLSRLTAEDINLKILSTAAIATFDHKTSQAALSYTWTKDLLPSIDSMKELLGSGVYDFIFDPFLLGISTDAAEKLLQNLKEQLENFEGRLWLHSKSKTSEPWIKVLSAQEIVSHGAHAVDELSMLIDKVIKWAQEDMQNPIGVALYLETDFFKTIAKKRAFVFMLESALETLQSSHLLQKISIIGKTPWRSFTGFDHESNILRNSCALAAAYIAGFDVVESLPHDLIVKTTPQNRAQAQRVALTSQLVLQNEAYLGEVKDAARGSYSLEELTGELIEKSWKSMQEICDMDESQQLDFFNTKLQSQWNKVNTQFQKRQLVQTGVNDFALSSQKIQIEPRWLKNDHVRLAREFEELRTQMTSHPKVLVIVIGNYAKLQNRLNFTRNYFETLGISVEEQQATSLEKMEIHFKDYPICVWVTDDELHDSLQPISKRCYVAGKTKVKGCLNIFMGQNIYESLLELKNWWSQQ
jgi:hypothetical protein